MSFTQCYFRGHEKVSGEWKLVALAYNLKRLSTMKCAPQTVQSPG